MDTEISAALRNWIPYKLFIENNEPLCRWLYVGDHRFTEPFFDETIARCRQIDRDNHAQKCVSSVEILPFWSGFVESVRPTALIFHVSRCGSTLASQLLALDPSNIVLSEVPFFDELIRWNKKTKATIEETAGLLRAAITFYAAKRDNEQRLFVKTDSWHILFYELFRQIYPTTPFILLYRRPEEVIRSQQKRRGIQSVPGLIEPELFGFDPDVIKHKPLDHYMASVLEAYFERFIHIVRHDPLAFPINYSEGSISIINKIAELSSFSITPGQMEKIQQRVNYHGKYPEQVFAEERISELIAPYCTRAFELYEQLAAIAAAESVAKE